MSTIRSSSPTNAIKPYRSPSSSNPATSSGQSSGANDQEQCIKVYSKHSTGKQEEEAYHHERPWSEDYIHHHSMAGRQGREIEVHSRLRSIKNLEQFPSTSSRVTAAAAVGGSSGPTSRRHEGQGVTDCDTVHQQQLPSEFMLSLWGASSLTSHHRRETRGQKVPAASIRLIQYKLLRDEPGLKELLVECRGSSGCGHHNHYDRDYGDRLAKFKVLATCKPNSYYATSLEKLSKRREERSGCSSLGSNNDDWRQVADTLELTAVSVVTRHHVGRMKLEARLQLLHGISSNSYTETSGESLIVTKGGSSSRGRDVISFRFCQLRTGQTRDNSCPETTTLLHIHRPSSSLRLAPTNKAANDNHHLQQRAAVIHLAAGICLSHLHVTVSSSSSHPPVKATGSRPTKQATGRLSPLGVSSSSSSSCESPVSCKSATSGPVTTGGQAGDNLSPMMTCTGSSVNSDSSLSTVASDCSTSSSTSIESPLQTGSDLSASSSSLSTMSSDGSIVAERVCYSSACYTNTNSSHETATASQLSKNSYYCCSDSSSISSDSCVHGQKFNPLKNESDVPAHTGSELQGRCSRCSLSPQCSGRSNRPRIRRRRYRKRNGSRHLIATHGARDAQTQANPSFEWRKPVKAATLTEKRQQQQQRLSFKCPNCKIKIRSAGGGSATASTLDTPPQQKVNQRQLDRNLEWSPPIRVEGPLSELKQTSSENLPAPPGRQTSTTTTTTTTTDHLSKEPEHPISGGATKILLSPMDFVWRGLGSDVRALSCTEASLSGDSSSIVAQLAAASRSKSLCTESRAQLKNLAGRSPAATKLPKSILAMGEKVGRLTRNAINHIKLLSASNSSLRDDARATAPQESSVPSRGAGTNNRAGYYSSKRRASSQRHHRGNKPSSNDRRPLDEMVITHKLNRFTSVSAANLDHRTSSGCGGHETGDDGGGGNTSDKGGGSELFYSPDGVYLGPGGICSWQDVYGGGSRKAQIGSLWPQGGAASWLARPLRSSLAQALVGSTLGLSEPTKRRQQQQSVPPVIIYGVSSDGGCSHQSSSGDHQRASQIHGRSSSVAIGSGGAGFRFQHETYDGGGGDTTKRFSPFQSRAQSDRGALPTETVANQITDNRKNSKSPIQSAPSASDSSGGGQGTRWSTWQQTPAGSIKDSGQVFELPKPNGVVLYEPTDDVNCSKIENNSDLLQIIAQNQTASMSANQAAATGNKTSIGRSGHKPWILNLTQRYHSSGSAKPSPPPSNRGSQKKRDRAKLSCESSKMDGSKCCPHLAKEARSNSLSGLYQSERLVDLSKSSMELNNYGQTLAEQTSLYLEELKTRYSGSTHELTPPPQKGRGDSEHGWFQRSPSSSIKGSHPSSTHNDQLQKNDDQQQQQPPSDQATSEAVANRRRLLVSEEPASQELYGANLQSICVHCQLIAELASHPASAYLSQLISGRPWEQKSELPPSNAASDKLPVRPSVVLTVCSNQGTVDDDDEDDDDDDADDEGKEAPLITAPTTTTTPTTVEGPSPYAAGGDRGLAVRSKESAGPPRRDSIKRDRHGGQSNQAGGRRQQKAHYRHHRGSPPSTCSSAASSSASLNSSTADGNDDRRHRRGTKVASQGSKSHSASVSSDDDDDVVVAVAADANVSDELSEAVTSNDDEDGDSGGHSSEVGSLSLSQESASLQVASSDLDDDQHDETRWPPPPPPRVHRHNKTERLHEGHAQPDELEGDETTIKKARRLRRQAAKRRRRRRHSKREAKVASIKEQPLSQAGKMDPRRQRRAEAEDEDSAADDEEPLLAGGDSCLLSVPGNKQARSASLDAPYLLKVPERQELEDVYDESCPGKSNRSRSVDISLPTKPGEAYTVRQLAANQAAVTAKQTQAQNDKRSLSVTPYESELIIGPHQIGQKKFIQGEIKVACANGETRALKLFVDWQDDCINGEHLWIYAGSSSEACYVGENECLKHGPRLCCSACKITAHTSCISILIHKIKFICKHTFKDLTVNNPRHIKELQQHNVIYHHWVHKRTHCGRCKQCTKTFGNTKLPFSSKEIQAITCSWCKVSYHNKENCYTLSALTEPCTLGAHRESIIPPTWILKLPAANNQQQQQHSSCDVGNLNNNNQSQEVNELMQSENLIELSLANQAHAFKIGSDSNNNNKENSENLRLQQHHSTQTLLNRSINQHYLTYGSNTTLMTDTSGYLSADGSNVQSLITGNHQANNRVICDNYQDNKTKSSPNYKRNPGSVECSEIVIDPSALQAADLSIINYAQQNQQQPKLDRHQHPQESSNQFQKHQLKQYYRQLDSNQNLDQPKPGNKHDMNEDTSMFIDLQLMQNQQQHPIKQSTEGLYRNFRIVPQPIQGISNAGSKPVLVFVNPRSGGNQGAKMMQKFNWLLNPRQVFDLIQSNGPRAALELYRDVPNLRILTIGGDGTASWILSYLDEVGISNRIPVAVLPLGTGNDLARALGWGGGYADEPIAKILTQVRDGEVVQLDRWNLHVERNYEVTPSSPNEFSSSSGGYMGNMNIEISPPSISSSPSYFGSLSQSNTNTASTISIIDQMNCDTSMTQTSTNTIAGFNAPTEEAGRDRLPMDVINNYFSFGVDAHIALEFHTAREAHPERFNSRLRNKMFYGQAGGKDLLKRKWKDLSNFVTLYCDEQDMTSRLKELKVHSVLFLNIPSYGGGTRPWPTTATSFAKPRTDDGLIEVIGLTTYQLPLLQAGGHGTCIAQCRNARIITSRTIPMQVDGEPCKLLPSIINISFKNRVCMLAKSKSSSKSNNMTTINTQKNN